VQKLAGKPFALIGANVSGCDRDKLAAVMQRENLTWRSFVTSDAIAKAWNRPGTPTLYLVDHRGVIRRKWLGRTSEQAIDAAIGELLDELHDGATRAGSAGK
jgi:hypothetical protein